MPPVSTTAAALSCTVKPDRGHVSSDEEEGVVTPQRHEAAVGSYGGSGWDSKPQNVLVSQSSAAAFVVHDA